MRNEDIRKLAETYRPNPQVIADRILNTLQHLDKAIPADPFGNSMKLADEAIARMMRK